MGEACNNQKSENDKEQDKINYLRDVLEEIRNSKDEKKLIFRVELIVFLMRLVRVLWINRLKARLKIS